ncbi:phage portal protein [Sphingomonas oryzagri]|uniref:Phage portal protein n=1 Tax=Sphingomonas oryzagri TaxID=3042314 RepID=A0ABT6N7X0_9SPHN|nr:phage portal protein [Sphingomonas oryzagri]MDH7641181.1 phage portal protein [Sphingomonas oryzagri]
MTTFANDNRAEATTIAAQPSPVQAFSFGDPEPVLGGRRAILDMCECVNNGQYWEPPLPMEGLARAYWASPHHSSAMQLKRNRLISAFIPSRWLSRKAFAALVQDYLVLANGYLEVRVNRLGGVLRLDHALAKYTRRGLEDGQFFYLENGVSPVEFDTQVIQITQPDLNQEYYGIPEYVSALQSAFLNEAATLFRRKYYENGSHAGYIMHAKGQFTNIDTDTLKEALRRSKGPGNFRSLFVQTPEGKDTEIKIIPIAQLGASDEFLGIKGTSRDDILAAHRVPPQLLGIVPAQGSSGFGNPLQATDMFDELEITPIQAALLDINEQIGVEAVKFAARVPLAGTPAKA